MIGSTLWPVAGQGAAALCLWTLAFGLVAIHPLLSLSTGLVAVGMAVMSAARPYWGLMALLGLLPVASLSIWSGWRVTDEFDVLLLLILGGGCTREAWLSRPYASPRVPAPHIGVLPLALGWPVRLAWGGVLLTWAVSAWRGWVDAGASAPDLLWDGYDSTGNVWRVAKSMVGLLLVAPWLRALYRRSPQRAIRSLHGGLLIGLILVCGLAVWERAVYIGLWDPEQRLPHHRLVLGDARGWRRHRCLPGLDRANGMVGPVARPHSVAVVGRRDLAGGAGVRGSHHVFARPGRGVCGRQCVAVVAVAARASGVARATGLAQARPAVVGDGLGG
jgi:hypothetical protein